MTEQQAIKIINEEKSWESDDRKIDAFIMAVNALGEIQKYRELEQKLNGVDLAMLVNTFMEMAAEGEIQGYQRGRILTNEDSDKWDAYLAIGTPEEFRKCMDIVSKSEVNELSKIIDEWLLYHKLGSPEECQAAVEKQKAKRPTPIDYKKYMDVVDNAVFLRGDYWCPSCNHVVRSGVYCNDCGQKLDWGDEE